jgi:hypothetical protein
MAQEGCVEHVLSALGALVGLLGQQAEHSLQRLTQGMDG